jgi:DNA-binding response OmpR family regulator
LVIDDDPNTRAVIEVILRTLGLRVDLAAGGREGLERARSLRPDLVVLDDRLPDIASLEVLRRLGRSAQTAGIPVVVLSAVLPEHEARVAGADALLPRPFAIDHIEMVVRRCLHLPFPDRDHQSETG